MEDKEAAIAQLLTQMKEYPRDVAEALYETLSGDELSMKINKCEQTIKEKDKQIQNLQEELKKLRAKQKTTSNISEENITKLMLEKDLAKEQIKELQGRLKSYESKLLEEQDEVKKFQSKLSKTINSLEEEKKKSEKVRNMLIKLLVNIDINQLIQLFYGNVTAESLENLGGIHKSGYLMKQALWKLINSIQFWFNYLGQRVKSWKVRYFILKDVFFFYFEDKKDFPPLGVINVYNATISDVDQSTVNKCFCFSIRTSVREIFCCAQNELEKQNWMTAIQNATHSF